MTALRQSLSKNYLSIVSHCDSAFYSMEHVELFKEHASNYVEREPIGDESDQACFMVKRITPLR